MILNKLYNETVEISFNPYGHQYLKDGEIVPSVTTINGVVAKPMLVPWASKMAVEHMRENIVAGETYDEIQLEQIFVEAQGAHAKRKTDAGTLGTFVHKWVETYIKWKVAGSEGEMPAMLKNVQAKRACERFLKWEEEHKVKFLASEQMVYSKKYNYVGTLDFICLIDGKLYIGDLKTSNGIWNEYYLQTAAYRNARQEEFPTEKYAGQVIVRVGKSDDEFGGRDNGLEIAYIKGDEWYTKMFIAFLGAWKLWQMSEELKKFKPEKQS